MFGLRAIASDMGLSSELDVPSDVPGSMRVRKIDNPAWPLTLSSSQNVSASDAVILLPTQTLAAPKPSIVWYFVDGSTAHVAAKTGANDINTVANNKVSTAIMLFLILAPSLSIFFILSLWP
jgi:hypothetical protein